MSYILSTEEIETLESYIFVTNTPYIEWQGGQAPSLTEPLATNKEEFDRLYMNHYEKPASKYSPECKIVSSTYKSTLFHFDELMTITKEGNPEAGAILVDVACTEQWIPKKLCKNLDLEARTVYVWQEFIDPIIKELAEED